MDKINLAEKLSRFTEVWSPKIVGELNDMEVKVVKLRGEFVWHHHEAEDELFLVVQGTLQMQFRDRVVTVQPGEFIIVPHGVEHCPRADTECHVMLLERKGTLNTGNVQNERTVHNVGRL